MPSTVYSTSQTNGFSFALPDVTIIVAPDVTISETSYNAAFSNDDNSHLINYGNLLASAPGEYGVKFSWAATGSIWNAASGVIAGDVGVGMDGVHITLTNLGSIDGVIAGVEAGNHDITVLNHGYVHGVGIGISVTSSTGGDVIYNTGLVDSDKDGIRVGTNPGATATEIVNAGTIQGGAHAIHAVVGSFHFTNEGTLIGDILSDAIGPVDDTIVNSGKIKGDVHLGNGNDTFNGVSGSSGAIFGEAGIDRLTGGSAGDKIDGGADNDTLTGGAGADHFVFDTALVANVDRIVDFKHGIDKFELAHTIFAGAGAAGTMLTAAHFFKGAHAHDASDRIIYNPTNGFVYYDSNGNGAGHEVHFATLAHGLVLSQADFLIV